MKDKILSAIGPIVLVGTLLVSIPRYAAAFAQAEPQFMGLTIAPVTGLGFGVLIELGVYYVIDSWFDAQRRKLKNHWLLLVGFSVQLLIAPIIIAPAIVGHLSAAENELSSVLTWQPALWAWAIFAAAAPALLLASAAAASFLREPASKKAAGGQQDSEPKLAGSRVRLQRARYVCGTCGQQFGSQPALNAHQRVHAGSEADGNGREPAEIAEGAG